MARQTVASEITLTDEERATLERLLRRRKVSRGEAQRAEIVLRAGDGMNNSEIADTVGVTRQTVRVWRERFARHRLDGLGDEPRCGAPRKIGDDRIEAIVVKTLETKPTDATYWSTRGMAKASVVFDVDGAPDLESVLATAASQRNVQALDRSAVRRKGARHRRTLPEPAAERARHLCR